MKKTLALLLLAAMLTAPLAGCSSSDDTEGADNGSTDGTPTEKEVWLLHTEYSTREKVKQTYTYDEYGNKIQYTAEDANGNVTATWILEYDDHNNLLKRSVVSGGKEPFVQLIMTYDENGKLIERREINTVSESVFTYQYDDQNRVIARLYQSGNPSETYSYNADGSYKVQYGSDSGDYALYDADGNVQERHYGSDTKIVYSYNQDNVLVEAVQYSGKTIVQKQIFQLDKHGNPVKVIVVNSDGSETVISEREYKLYKIKVR